MNEIKLSEIIKQFKIQKPTTGKIELTILAEDNDDVQLYVKCTKDEVSHE